MAKYRLSSLIGRVCELVRGLIPRTRISIAANFRSCLLLVMNIETSPSWRAQAIEAKRQQEKLSLGSRARLRGSKSHTTVVGAEKHYHHCWPDGRETRRRLAVRPT